MSPETLCTGTPRGRSSHRRHVENAGAARAGPTRACRLRSIRCDSVASAVGDQLRGDGAHDVQLLPLLGEIDRDPRADAHTALPAPLRRALSPGAMAKPPAVAAAAIRRHAVNPSLSDPDVP